MMMIYIICISQVFLHSTYVGFCAYRKFHRHQFSHCFLLLSIRKKNKREEKKTEKNEEKNNKINSINFPSRLPLFSLCWGFDWGEKKENKHPILKVI